MLDSSEKASWQINLSEGGTLQVTGLATIDGDDLIVVLDDGSQRQYPITDITILVPPHADGARGLIMPITGSTLRLAFVQVSFMEALRQHPRFGLGVRRGRGLERRQIFYWMMGAAASLIFIVLVVIPIFAERIAAAIPPAYERRLGSVVAEQVVNNLSSSRAGAICSNSSGREALDGLIARLEAVANAPHPIIIRVSEAPAVNAFAVPGGQIILLSGLIAFTETPEELAGVVAHEIAHVVRRDPARGMIRSMAVGAVAGLVFGDALTFSTLGVLAASLLQTSYSRDVETKTDMLAFEILAAANMDTKGFATFFERLQKKEGEDSKGVMAYLSTHPPSEQRAALARAASKPGLSNPALPSEAWRDIKRDCGPRDTTRARLP
jgi:Zn-dependent protease with chaperone function